MVITIRETQSRNCSLRGLRGEVVVRNAVTTAAASQTGTCGSEQGSVLGGFAAALWVGGASRLVDALLARRERAFERKAG